MGDGGDKEVVSAHEGREGWVHIVDTEGACGLPREFHVHGWNEGLDEREGAAGDELIDCENIVLGEEELIDEEGS